MLLGNCYATHIVIICIRHTKFQNYPDGSKSYILDSMQMFTFIVG